jgi:hypothetical protein
MRLCAGALAAFYADVYTLAEVNDSLLRSKSQLAAGSLICFRPHSPRAWPIAAEQIEAQQNVHCLHFELAIQVLVDVAVFYPDRLGGTSPKAPQNSPNNSCKQAKKRSFGVHPPPHRPSFPPPPPKPRSLDKTLFLRTLMLRCLYGRTLNLCTRADHRTSFRY